MTAPRGVVKTSLGVERAHVGSAIELRYRRQIATAFFATQERFTFYHGSCVGVPIPMRKPPTGEPCAGELHARFGGRGRRKPFPTPIVNQLPRIGVQGRRRCPQGGCSRQSSNNGHTPNYVSSGAFHHLSHFTTASTETVPTFSNVSDTPTFSPGLS